MIIVQILIALIGMTAVWLSLSVQTRWRRWGPIVGLCGQPLWAALFITDRRWLMLAVVALYTFTWMRGIWTLWIVPRRAITSTRAVRCVMCGRSTINWVDPEWAHGRICRTCESAHQPRE